MRIIQSVSPNFDSRKGYKPDVIVLHVTDGNWPGDLKWLRSSKSQVSSHFIISPSGEIHQLVSVEERAWHAGRIIDPIAPLKKTFWGTRVNPNQYTIGIEISLKPSGTMNPKQEKSLLWLLEYLEEKYNIPLIRENVWGHSEIRGDKLCPYPINVDKVLEKLDEELEKEVDKVLIKEQIIELLNKL